MPTLRKIFSTPLVQIRDRWMLSDRLPGKNRQWPVRADAAANYRNPFFVLGHPRSGTTLLRAMLCRHPDVFIPPENGALWRMIRVFGDNRASDWSQVVDRVMTEFEKGYEYAAWGLDSVQLRDRALDLLPTQRTLQGLIHAVYECYGERFAAGKRVWGDKTTPGDFDYLDKLSLVFPQAKYLHIVRDGRDCVASAMKVGFYDKDIRVAARAWRDNVRHCRRFVRGGKRIDGYLEFQYETLVSDPADLLPQICTVLGIDVDTSVLDHAGDVSDLLPDVKALRQHANVARPIFGNSVGNWQRELSEQQVREVEQIMGSELRHCGYQLASD